MKKRFKILTVLCCSLSMVLSNNVFAQNASIEAAGELSGVYLNAATGMKLRILQDEMTADFQCYNSEGTLIAEEYDCPIKHVYLEGKSWFIAMRLDGALQMYSNEDVCLGNFEKTEEEIETLQQETEGINGEQQKVLDEVYAQIVGKTFHKKGYQTSLNFISENELTVPADIDISYEYTLSAEKEAGADSYYPYITLDGETYALSYFPADRALTLTGDGAFNGWYEEANASDSSNSGEPQKDGTVWTVSVETGYLALRTGMAYDVANEIGKLYTGDKVERIEMSSPDYWYVYSPTLNQYGYVNCHYLF